MELEEAKGVQLSTTAYGCGQAVLEIVTRAAVVLFCVCGLVSSSIALGTVNSIPSDVRDIIDDRSNASDVFNDSDLPVTPDIVRNTRITCGLVIAFSSLTVVLQVLITFLCCFNVGLITTSGKTKRVRLIDMLLSTTLGAGFIGGLVLAVFFTIDWSDWVDAVDMSPNVFDKDDSDPHNFTTIQNALGITAGACFGVMIIFLLLVIRICYILFNSTGVLTRTGNET